MKHSAYPHVLAYTCSFVLTIATAVQFFGLFFQHEVRETGWGFFLLSLVACTASALALVHFGRKIRCHSPAAFYAVTGSLILSLAAPVFAAEVLSGKKIPPWPAIALHGVDPGIGKTAWGRIQSLDTRAVGNNSWGQRDKERTVIPPDGQTRIAFIGDSFLEESSITPVSLLVEASLPPSFDIMNLGVSATGPLDYYWTLKNVALKLGVSHVLVFMFMGNDLLDSEPRDDRNVLTGGIFAPPPRSSLLGSLLPATNYQLSRKYKKPIQAWMAHDLHRSEQAQMDLFRRVAPEGLSQLLASYDLQDGGSECRRKLSTLDLRDLHQMLKNPDMGLFRTYILTHAVTRFCRRAGGSSIAVGRDTGAYTLRLVDKMKSLALESDVGMSIVVVPQGFDVDDRYREQWLVLADFREELGHSLKASHFKDRLSENRIHVIDLYPRFASSRGTYLNVDGHWSQLGNELAAEVLVEAILKLKVE